MKVFYYIISALILTDQVHADERLSLKIAGYDYPPLYYVNKSKQIEGVFFNVIKKMCDLQNFDCQFIASSAARSYKQLEDQSIDILITGKIARFNDCCKTTDWSYPWTGGIYSRNELSKPVGSSLLLDKSLVIPLGLELPFFVFKELKAQQESNITSVINARTARLTLKMFGKGRGDFIWSSIETEALLREYSDDKAATYYFYPLITIPVVAWVNVSNPEYDKIVNGFNNAYIELKALKKVAHNGLLID